MVIDSVGAALPSRVQPARTVGGLLGALRGLDLTRPAGEPALAAPDSLSWQVFKNPVGLFIGGVTAVLLELAEPRVRSGVWEHSSFRHDPAGRLQRTGLAAMVTVYGPRSMAEAMIAGVGRRHGKVTGQTPDGANYRADDPELLDWVQATASFGFLEAYSAYVRPLNDAERDRFYAEAKPAAALYGAHDAPGCLVEQRASFEAMRDHLEPHPIVFEFLELMAEAKLLPGPLRAFQPMMLRAAVALLPDWVRERLELGAGWTLKPWEERVIRLAGAAAERTPIPGGPPAQACLRLGLPANYLYLPERGRGSERRAA